MMQGDILTVEITGLNSEGEGIARTGAEGFVLFVPCALTGEEAEVRIVTKKKNYGTAKIIRRITDSPFRKEPRCPSFGRCGGCSLQHLSYPSQLLLKKELLTDALERIGGIKEPSVLDCEASPSEWHYRNKAAIPVQSAPGEEIRAGFYKVRSHNIVPYSGCCIAAAEINEMTANILSVLRKSGFCGVRQNGMGRGREVIRHIVLRKARFTEDALCAVICARALSAGERVRLGEALRGVKGLTGAVCNINTSSGNFIWGEKNIPLFGRSTMRERLGKYELTFEASSFFQVNSEQTLNLYSYAASLALENSPSEILELYAGTGSMTVFLAAGGAEITAVESWKPAAKYIAKNAAANGLKKITPLAERSEDIIQSLYGQNFSAVVLDPPRTGCDEKVITAISAMNAERIIYVSCNPATLARDIKRLTEKGYKFIHAKPFDMFPQTGHVETVVLLCRKHIDAEKQISVTIEAEDGWRADKPVKATYSQIKDWVSEHYNGMKVHTLYIAQVKEKYGLIERENYNKSKKSDAKVPQVPPDKEEAIEAALRHFRLIEN